MKSPRILVLGMLPVLMERSLSHVAELVFLSREMAKNSLIEDAPASSINCKSVESWQEKPKRNGGFAAARRAAKKKRRRHG